MLTREHFNRWYKLGPYFLSLVSFEIPFQVSCSFESDILITVKCYNNQEFINGKHNIYAIFLLCILFNCNFNLFRNFNLLESLHRFVHCNQCTANG